MPTRSSFVDVISVTSSKDYVKHESITIGCFKILNHLTLWEFVCHQKGYTILHSGTKKFGGTFFKFIYSLHF